MLPSLRITQFKAFRSLEIDRLGAVNLFVGKNNVGKTILLDALRLFTASDLLDGLRTLLWERDEVLGGSRGAEEEEAPFQVASLFHGRPRTIEEAGQIFIGCEKEPERALRLALSSVARTGDPDRPLRWSVALPSDADDASVVPGLLISTGQEERAVPLSSLNDRFRWRRRGPLGTTPSRAPFVPARGVTDRDVALWWDAVALRDAEDRIVSCLRLLAPVERVTMVEHPGNRGERMAMVRLDGQAEPVPLKSLGDGMVRLLQVALAAEASAAAGREGGQLSLFAARGIDARPPLLIDEIENGVHYTALPKLWEFIFKFAEMHSLQVFATSHSWDCIMGFQEASASFTSVDAKLVRLESAREETTAIVFDRGELTTIIRERMEVR